MRLPVRSLAFIVACLPTVAFAQPIPGRLPIGIAVDASQAPRKFFSATLTIPVSPGPLTLHYPKWIPGEHGPTGPIVDSAGLTFKAGDTPLAWSRDPLDMFTYHLDVPPGTSEITATLDYVSPVPGEGGFSAGATATDQMAVISWNTLVLYPEGMTADEVTCAPRLRLPPGWKFGTALPVATRDGDTVTFKPASLYTLVDSPVIAGAHLRVVPLTPPGAERPVEMDIASDSAAALDMGADLDARYHHLVSEAYALFGAQHYRDYHFLLSLSDHLAHFGLEHHESNDSRSDERGLIDPSETSLMASLLPHEFVHSWNGKYRRPADLTPPDYQQPEQTDMLWVYEGLTEYLGDVLTARSGLWTPEQYREHLAMVAAGLDHRSGRTWRPLQDTATDAQVLYEAPTQWSNWRRGVDFYDEGELIWLEADTLIRQQTHGERSLDDFCRAFYGPPDTPPMVKTYTFDDLVTALNQVAPYDWRGFFRTRLQSTSPHAPLGGITAGGWKLAYADTPTTYERTVLAKRGIIDTGDSLGLLLSSDGRVLDVNLLMPAAKAGLAPGMRIVAVNSRAFSSDVLDDALAAGRAASSGPIELLVENTGFFKTCTVDYHGGARYPRLEREAGRPDLLAEILKPHRKE